MRQPFTIIPPGAPSSAPRLNVRERLSKMHNCLRDTALVGGGLGADDIEGLTAELGAILNGMPANDGTARQLSGDEIIARAWTDLDDAERAIGGAKNLLRASIGEDEVDPSGGAAQRIDQVVKLCMKAQASIGSVRIARS